MLSLWVCRVKGRAYQPCERACAPAVLKGVRASRVKERVCQSGNIALCHWNSHVHKMMISMMMCLPNSQDDDSMMMCLSNSHDSQDDDSMPMCLPNSQDDDSMMMCLSKSQDDYIIPMCLSNSQSDVFITVWVCRVKERACQPCERACVSAV